MRLRGPWLINQSRLDTSVSSQGGMVGANSAVVVTLSAYSFFPDRETQMLTLGAIAPMFAPVPSANEGVPQFFLVNNDGTPRLYDVEWRHINP